MTKKPKAARKPATSPKPKAAPKKPKAAAPAKKAAKPAPEKPAEAKPGPAVASDAKVQFATLDQIEPSPLNPRTKRDPDKVAEMAASIALHGIQQPLKVRPHPKKSGKFEIVFGGTRREAVELLIKSGRAAKDYKLPIVVEQMTDAKLRELAMIENVQRADLHPLDEGRGFIAMRDEDNTPTAVIAQRIGKSQRFVQQRIDMVKRLTPEVQKAFVAGEVNTKEATALLTAEKDLQGELLRDIKAGYVGFDEIKSMARDTAIPVKGALFNLADYIADGGTLIEDDEGKDGPWFGDVAKFQRLQRKAIELKETELKAKWGGGCTVIRVGKGVYFSEYEWTASNDRKTAGAVIVVEETLEAKVREGLLPKRSAKSEPAQQAKKAVKAAGGKAASNSGAPQITQAQMIHAKNRKSEAMQDRIAFDPLRAGKAAIVLSCIALMGESEVARIRPADINTDDKAMSPLLRDAIDGFRGTDIGELLRAAPRGKDIADVGGILELKERAAPAAFERLWEWPMENLTALHACLIAARCGTFNGYTPELGDDPLAQTVARVLGVDMAQHWGFGADGNWPAYLDLCKKSRLVRMVAHMPGLDLDPDKCEKMKTPELVEAIKAALAAHPEQRGFIPQELTFGDGKEIEKAINRAPEKRQPAPELKAAGNGQGGKADKAAEGGKAKAPAKAKAKAAKPAGKGKATPAEAAGATA